MLAQRDHACNEHLSLNGCLALDEIYKVSTLSPSLLGWEALFAPCF